MARHRLIGMLALAASVLVLLLGVACAYLGVRLAMESVAGGNPALLVGAAVMFVLLLFSAGVSWLAWRWGRHRMKGLRDDTLELNRTSILGPKPR
jgi:hypothetical protein